MLGCASCPIVGFFSINGRVICIGVGAASCPECKRDYFL